MITKTKKWIPVQFPENMLQLEKTWNTVLILLPNNRYTLLFVQNNHTQCKEIYTTLAFGREMILINYVSQYKTEERNGINGEYTAQCHCQVLTAQIA